MWSRFNTAKIKWLAVWFIMATCRECGCKGRVSRCCTWTHRGVSVNFWTVRWRCLHEARLQVATQWTLAGFKHSVLRVTERKRVLCQRERSRFRAGQEGGMIKKLISVRKGSQSWLSLNCFEGRDIFFFFLLKQHLCAPNLSCGSHRGTAFKVCYVSSLTFPLEFCWTVSCRNQL